MYPYVREGVVLVDGPGATGIYDLHAGTFLRVSKDAGAFLRRLNGTTHLSLLDEDEREFVIEAVGRGIVVMEETSSQRQQTHLSDVIRPYRLIKFAWIEITSKCNQACLHCFVGDDLNKTPHMPVAKIFSYIDTLVKYGTRHVVVSGGEPTLHPEFEAILDYIGRTPLRISVLSNASTGHIIRLADCFLRNDATLKVPLLGWGDIHDQMVAVSGCFHRTIAAIDELRAQGVNIQLGTTVTALNHGDISRIRDFALSRGLPLEVSPVYSIGWAKKNQQSLLSIPMAKIIGVCKENPGAAPAEGRLITITRRKNTYEPNPADYEAVDLHGFLTEHHECGQKIIAILANGMVTPCLMLRDTEHILGALEHNTLEEILDGRTAERKDFDELMKLEAVSSCNVCEARFVCKAGGCPASAYALTGSVQQKNPLYEKCYYTNGETKQEMEP